MLYLLSPSDRTTRFASFPDHLVIQIKKFTFGLDWVPKKLGRQWPFYILRFAYVYCMHLPATVTFLMVSN